jgi:hypothetical protein
MRRATAEIKTHLSKSGSPAEEKSLRRFGIPALKQLVTILWPLPRRQKWLRGFAI